MRRQTNPEIEEIYRAQREELQRAVEERRSKDQARSARLKILNSYMQYLPLFVTAAIMIGILAAIIRVKQSKSIGGDIFEGEKKSKPKNSISAPGDGSTAEGAEKTGKKKKAKHAPCPPGSAHLCR